MVEGDQCVVEAFEKIGQPAAGTVENEHGSDILPDRGPNQTVGLDQEP